MKKSKKSASKTKRSARQAADQATEQIVQMIAQSIGSLPAKERHAAMEAFDLTANAISTRSKKTSTPRKAAASRRVPKRRKGS